MDPDSSERQRHFYHAIGSFWMVEDGLVRTGSHAGIETFLFPYLHHLKNSSVTKKVSNMIQGVLPPEVPAQLKADYTAKSARIGAASELMMDPTLNGLGDICGRTGHSTGTSVEFYQDLRNVVRGVRGVRGGRVLAGWNAH